MSAPPVRRQTVALGVAGAAVVGAVALLGYILTLPGPSTGAVALGVAIVLLAALSAAGVWTSRPVVAWPPALVLLVLGFLGIAIGPQIIAVGTLAVLAATVLAFEQSG